MSTDNQRPSDRRADVHGSRGAVDPTSGDPVTPGQAQVGEAEMDVSTDKVEQNGFSRATQRTGARLAFGAIAVPVVLVLAVAVAMFLLRP